MTAEDTTAVGWSFLRSRRWFGYFTLLIIFSIACVWLATWQFDRRADAQAEISRIDRNYDASPVPLAEAIDDPSSFNEDTMKWLPVTVQGTYLDEGTLARGRPGAGGVGSNLVEAFLTTDGEVFFVDRGWVPVAGIEEIPDNLPVPPTGEVTITVRLRASELQISGRTSTDQSVASIHLPELAELIGHDGVVNTGAFGQLIDETPAAETGILAARPERDEGPHLSYALQWYVFIAIAAAGLVYGARQEHRSLNPAGASVLRQDARRAERKRRRGLSDADEEDALLDQ
ncbi:MAG: SURF1 family protein [Microbacteriaceae bacterium]|nr:SURF1 family protein [Microbacteriaceae bacterium]